jgi:hypothetical protein
MLIDYEFVLASCTFLAEVIICKHEYVPVSSFSLLHFGFYEICPLVEILVSLSGDLYDINAKKLQWPSYAISHFIDLVRVLPSVILHYPPDNLVHEKL